LVIFNITACGKNRLRVIGQLEKVDLLMANILAKPLVGLCEHFSKLVKLGGQLVLSGILHEQLEIILDAYGACE
jgi:ribosomal protein L11 methyltransferase